MGERLKTPPLVEALCEFRFSEGAAWDWVIPGQLYDKIKAEFPKRAQIQGIGLEVKTGAKLKTPVTTVHTSPERVQFKRSDGTSMVQVGFNLLAVNQLKPYTTWTEFLALVMRMLGEYQAIAGKAEFERIGLRYINQLALPKADSAISEHLTLTPHLNGHLDRPIQAFYQRYELKTDNPDGILVHQTGTSQDEEGKPFFVLDLDFGSTSVKDLKESKHVEDWLQRAHDRVYEAFIDSLNPKFLEEIK